MTVDSTTAPAATTEPVFEVWTADPTREWASVFDPDAPDDAQP